MGGMGKTRICAAEEAKCFTLIDLQQCFFPKIILSRLFDHLSDIYFIIRIKVWLL